jgi:hypothetical protein
VASEVRALAHRTTESARTSRPLSSPRMKMCSTAPNWSNRCAMR